MKRHTIHHISYMTRIFPNNDVLVAADSCEEANDILLSYLKENPRSKKFPEASLPEKRGYNCWETEHTSHKKGIVGKIFSGAVID